VTVGRRFRFFSLEALRSIRSNGAIAFSATATVLIAMLMLGVFLLAFSGIRAEVQKQEDKLDLRAFVKLGATDAEIDAAVKAVAAHPNVESSTFKSAAEVLEEQKEIYGADVIDLLPSNPYPNTIVIQPDDPSNQEQIVADLSPLEFWLKDAQSPNGFSVDQETTREFVSASRVLTWGLFGLTCILVIAAILLIGNTIRLSILARRREVEVMRLVGATNWFIRWPFVIEGIVFGLIGAIAAALLLVIGKVTIWDRLVNSDESPLGRDTEGVIGLPPLALILVLAGAVLGALGSGITLRRFLRV
jgi:cell division transport system permease protein